jgi:hypothetical protein
MTMRHLLALLLISFAEKSIGQASWPGSNWDVATNLTSVMSSAGVESLSGIHYNSSKNQLFMVQDIGRLRVIQLNHQSGNHLQLTDRNLGGDPEGITQINDVDNEFWVINENDYRIERYQHNNNFSTVNLHRSWDLLLPQSGMISSNDGGPEDICFVPDSFLSDAGFISSVSGEAYTSQKGMEGLIFIAHQNLGEIWVFDINQDVNDDFTLVGKYGTNRQESCGLSFDISTGLLYVLHNINNNYLEVCSLATLQVGQNYKLNTVQEFNVTVPTNGGKNIEGVAVGPKCENTQNPILWLVRDVTGSQSINALKQFQPFGLLGTCDDLTNQTGQTLNEPLLFPNPSSGIFKINQEIHGETDLEIYDLQGKIVSQIKHFDSSTPIDLSHLNKGFYFVKIDNQLIKFALN